MSGVDLKNWVYGRGNIKKGTWTGGRARNVENKNQSGIEGAI